MNALAPTIPPIRDPTGEMVVIDNSAVLTADPAVKRAIRLVADTLTNSDEIWYEWTDQPLGGAIPCFAMAATGIVRRYLARFQVDDDLIHLAALATVAPAGWALREIHVSEAALTAARRGWLAHRRA
jgi:hypothetical protein